MTAVSRAALAQTLRAAAARKWPHDPAAQRESLFGQAAAEIEQPPLSFEQRVALRMMLGFYGNDPRVACLHALLAAPTGTGHEGDAIASPML